MESVCGEREQLGRGGTVGCESRTLRVAFASSQLPWPRCYQAQQETAARQRSCHRCWTTAPGTPESHPYDPQSSSRAPSRLPSCRNSPTKFSKLYAFLLSSTPCSAFSKTTISSIMEMTLVKSTFFPLSAKAINLRLDAEFCGTVGDLLSSRCSCAPASEMGSAELL